MKWIQRAALMTTLVLSSAAIAKHGYQSVLLPGSKVVAGDLSQNEFFIVASNESTPKPAEAAPVVHVPVVANAAPVVKPTPLTGTSIASALQHKMHQQQTKMALAKPVKLHAPRSVEHPIVTATKNKSVSQVKLAIKKPVIANKQIALKLKPALKTLTKAERQIALSKVEVIHYKAAERVAVSHAVSKGKKVAAKSSVRKLASKSSKTVRA